MQKSRLIEILRTFSKKELRELKKWFASSFHNQRQDVIDLYSYLLNNNNLHNDKALDKEHVFHVLFPDEVFDDAKIRQVIHFMFKALESYLAYTSFIEKGLNKEINLAREYRRRKLKKPFEKITKNIESIQSKSTIQDDYYLYQKHLLQLEKYKFHNNSSERVGYFNLQEISDSFDHFFIANKLKYACLMLSHQTVFKTNYEYNFLNEILAHIEKKPSLLHIPSISIYYYVLKTLSEPDNLKHFDNLKNLLNENDSFFPLNEMYSLYLFAINYCSKKFNSGKSEFLEEAWTLLKEGIEKEILIEDGVLNKYLYSNLMSSGLRLKFYEEVEKYIHQYGELLDIDHRDNYINFFLTRLYFEKGDYDKAMALVSKYEFKDILINLSAKTILLKMYYELSEFIALESLLESMRAYLQRKKQLGNRINGYKNIVRYTKKLIKVNPYNKDQVTKLRQEIEEATSFTEKTWLLKQLDEL